MEPNPRSPSKLRLSFIAGVSALMMCAATSVFAANTANLPEYSAPVLTPQSQAATAWSNAIPNALADYYTYVPYANADAVALGFPAACGNKTLTTPADVASTADCYTISVRQLIQPTSLDFLKYVGIPGFTGAGLLQADGITPFSNTADPANPSGFLGSAAAGNLTTAWGYGSGGAGWMPNYPAGPAVTGNAPVPFRNVPFAALFGPSYNGDATATGVWHFPAPTIKGTTGRPVYVQWINDLPNVKPQGHDPSVDCGANAKFCYPYNRIVTHVHGAHVTPESDGLAVAWYTPNFALFGEGKFADNLYAGTPGKPIYLYPMTQESSTIWYHDHAVGTTHTNTNNGMAGFFPITDPNEQARIAEGSLPKPAFDNGFALQDRTFDTKAQMVMPDYATYDLTTPGCIVDPATNLADPNTCTRLQWAKVLTTDTVSTTNLTPVVKKVPMTSPEGIAATTVGNASYALNFPAGCTADLKNSFEGISLAGAPFTQCAPFPATSATLEYFGNMPVVNGVTYGNFSLENRVQRMRFIGGNDSRTWIMQIVKKGAIGTPTDCGTPTIVGGCMVYQAADIVPFWQIGSEQGLLDKPVRRDFIDLMDGERVDVLVDFTGFLPGDQFIVKNLGDDAPYSGAFDFANLATRQPTSVNIPEIFQFTLTAADFVANPNSALPSVLAAAAGAPLRPLAPLAYPVPAAGTPVRTVSLIEITDQYGRTMPTIDARGYIPPGMMTTEYIKQNSTEYWDIVNTTVDAHPMHIHQVAFRALYRQSIASFDPPFSDTITKVFSQPTYHAGVNAQIPVDPWDAGWKDTIPCVPGTVVRVVATWDLAGEYVWHCHILSHEEHDMMRPFKVVTASAVLGPKKLTAAVNNTQGTVTLSWPAVTGATGYVIHESIDNFVTSSYAVTTGPVLKAILKNKADGTYLYRIAAVIGTAQTAFTTSLTPVIVAKTVAAPSKITAPLLNDNGLIPVTWTASATPSFFASVTGGLYYPLQYLVTYDVSATLTTAPFTAYTTTGFTGIGPFAATIGQTPDPITGAVLGLPDGIYSISVVANLASWKPSLATLALNTTTVARVAQPVAKVVSSKPTPNTIKITWPASPTVGATYTVFQNGVQVATGITALTYTTGPLVNGIYTLSVRTDRVGLASSAIVADLTADTINVTNVAPSVTLTKNGTTAVILSWPTIAGATFTITQNAIVIPAVYTTQGLLTVVNIGGLVPATTYTFTIQNTTAGANPSKIVTKTVKM
jgi:FtsP/CotA-like multicopper oxidase with cupredoxin domain